MIAQAQHALTLAGLTWEERMNAEGDLALLEEKFVAGTADADDVDALLAMTERLQA